MPTAQQFYDGTAGHVATDTATLGALTSPTNMGANDNVYATALTSGITRATCRGGIFSNFGFDAQIPVGSVIDDVVIRVQVKCSGPGVMAVGGRVSGTETGTWSTVATSTSEVDIDTSIFADRAWTRADLLDAVFTVYVDFGGGTSIPINVSRTTSGDSVSVLVTYHAGMDPTQMSSPERAMQAVKRSTFFCKALTERAGIWLPNKQLWTPKPLVVPSFEAV